MRTKSEKKKVWDCIFFLLLLLRCFLSASVCVRMCMYIRDCCCRCCVHHTRFLNNCLPSAVQRRCAFVATITVCVYFCCCWLYDRWVGLERRGDFTLRLVRRCDFTATRAARMAAVLVGKTVRGNTISIWWYSPSLLWGVAALSALMASISHRFPSHFFPSLFATLPLLPCLSPRCLVEDLFLFVLRSIEEKGYFFFFLAGTLTPQCVALYCWSSCSSTVKCVSRCVCVPLLLFILLFSFSFLYAYFEDSTTTTTKIKTCAGYGSATYH